MFFSEFSTRWSTLLTATNSILCPYPIHWSGHHWWFPIAYVLVEYFYRSSSYGDSSCRLEYSKKLFCHPGKRLQIYFNSLDQDRHILPGIAGNYMADKLHTILRRLQLRHSFICVCLQGICLTSSTNIRQFMLENNQHKLHLQSEPVLAESYGELVTSTSSYSKSAVSYCQIYSLVIKNHYQWMSTSSTNHNHHQSDETMARKTIPPQVF